MAAKITIGFLGARKMATELAQNKQNERLFAILGSDGSDGNDVQRGQGIDVTVFTDDANFMRSDQNELGMRHFIFPPIRSANGKGTKPATQLSANLSNVHAYLLPQTISTVKPRFV